MYIKELHTWLVAKAGRLMRQAPILSFRSWRSRVAERDLTLSRSLTFHFVRRNILFTRANGIQCFAGEFNKVHELVHKQSPLIAETIAQ